MVVKMRVVAVDRRKKVVMQDKTATKKAHQALQRC